MLILTYFGKNFGMSSNLRTMCSMAGAGKFSDFFKLDWREQKWSLAVVLGAIVGGFIAYHFLSNGTGVNLNPETLNNELVEPIRIFLRDHYSKVEFKGLVDI